MPDNFYKLKLLKYINSNPNTKNTLHLNKTKLVKKTVNQSESILPLIFNSTDTIVITTEIAMNKDIIVKILSST